MDSVETYIEENEKLIAKIRKTLDIKTIKKMEERLINSGFYNDTLKKEIEFQKKVLSIKSSFQNKIPIMQHIIYTCLKRGSLTGQTVYKVIGELGYRSSEFSSMKLAERVGKFIYDLKNTQAGISSTAINLIIGYYENSKKKDIIKPSPVISKEVKSEKPLVPEPKKDELIERRMSTTDVFERWKKINITVSKNVRDVIAALLERKLLPTDLEGQQIIIKSGVDDLLISDYFKILEEICLKMDYKCQKDEIVKYLQNLTDGEIAFICDMERDGIAFGSSEFKKRYNNQFIRASVLNDYSFDKPNSIELNDGEKEFFAELKEKGINLSTTSKDEYKKMITEYREILSKRQLRINMIEQYFNLSRQIKQIERDSEKPLIPEPKKDDPSHEKINEATPDPTKASSSNELGLYGTPKEKIQQLYFKMHKLDADDEEFLQMVRDGKVDLVQCIRDSLYSHSLLRDHHEEVVELLDQVQNVGKKDRFFDRIKRHFTKNNKRVSKKDTHLSKEELFDETRVSSRRR